MGEAILIVDDNPANLKLARVVLHGAGHEVRVATDAEQALRLLETWHPRLILMDIQLPGMDGLTLTRRLKDAPATQDIIVIALTAYAMKGDEERARAAGCDGYISKPIDTEGLPGLVAVHLARATPPAPPLPAILIVDDNPATRKVFRLALEAAGYQIVEAATAAAALEAARQALPALALVDLILPDLRGADLASRLRALPGGADLPLVAVSGFPGLAADARSPLGEFDAVLVKPLDPARLVEIVGGYAPRAGVRAHEGTGRGKHVLVVDDDPVQLKLTALHLRHAGFLVSTAPGGVAAIAAARSIPPDVILSDVLMPGLDGFGLCLEIRGDERLARVPVVLASAHYREAADDDLARRVGANAFVVRSADVQEMIRVVKDQVGAPAPALADEPPRALEEAHRLRIVRQLERQAIANEGIVRRCAVQAAQIAILGGISDALAGSTDVEQAIDETLASCLDAGGISQGALYRAGAGELLSLRHAIGFSDEDRATLDTTLEYAQRVVASGVPVFVRPEIAAGSEAASDLPRLGVVVPLVADKQRVGALFLGTHTSAVAELDLLSFSRTIAAYLGQAIALANAFEREQQARREAERANRAKDEFLGILSHELRTPLTAILGWATLLSSRASDRAWLDRAVTTIRRNAKVQVQLIDDLFDVARINSGQLRIDAREMNVLPPIQAALDTIAPLAEAKGVRVEADLDPSAGTIWGDPDRVQQILWNVVCNAIEFTPHGGSVKVRLERREAQIRVEVSDDGEGIRPDFLPHVFERFRQADSSTTRAHGGLGLGLSIVHHLVALHGGEIHAESKGEGRGARFTVTLPLLAGSAAARVDPHLAGG